MPEIPQIDNLWEFFRENSAAIGPQLQLIIWGLGILCVDFLIPAQKKGRGAIYALGGLFMASIHLYWFWGISPGPAFYNMVTLDFFARYFNLLFLAAAFLTVIMSYRYLDIEDEQHTEYYALILFATAGMMFMAGAIDLVSLFVGLELMSISTYVLVGFLRSQKRSNEAAMKYFLLGAFSTGIILYGMSLLYGLSGSTNLNEIGRQIVGLENNTLLVLSLFMMMAGLCFKIAAVPFHMWVPDAYEGAPTSITAFMSVAVKAAAFAIFFRIFYLAFGDVREIYIFALAVIAMVTMTWGNVAALTQDNVKRLLAYSSISHAGFVLMGLVAGTDLGVTASAIYLLAYTFMNLGAWSVVILLRRQDIPGETLEDFNGLYFKHPAIAVLMLIFFLSLAGIPPLAGFIAKYFVFAAVLEVALSSGEAHSSLMVWVAVVGALNVVVSVYYYFRIVVSMFIRKDYLPAPLSFSAGLVVVLVITGLFTVLIGIYPEPFISLARAASLSLT
ncbi:NADH-quinone oxidoreductase subunit N [Acidobacteria bacterium AH-259-G07]|nr:NADH-quinone oxidoreductase subunit N [Acidobacteria bacterium AH-259-G07]